jgi:carboxylate-amine ligase
MQPTYSLFEVFGVELEYMLVEQATLDVFPIADRVLAAAAGEIVCEVEQGEISWSNELALHVIELKTTEPAPELERLPDAFQQQIESIGEILAPLQGRLLPTAMHPWMDPDREMRLWPHEYNPVYEAYNRIFDCRGHGWSNLQSVHLNLPFNGDDQFGRLHAAIRLLLPLLPALAASSPIVAGELTGWADNRLRFYRTNSQRVPSLTGQVVPEEVFNRADYDQHIFQVMYADIAPYDPDQILAYEWLNSRGAIARFDRNAIEIRVLDIQEKPAADIAICETIVAILKLLVSQNWTSYAEQQSIPTDMLARVLDATSRDAEQTIIDSPQLLRQFGCNDASITAAELWRRLGEPIVPQISQRSALQTILESGPLARRIQRAVQPMAGNASEIPHQRLQDYYQSLCLTR